MTNNNAKHFWVWILLVRLTPYEPNIRKPPTHELVRSVKIHVVSANIGRVPLNIQQCKVVGCRKTHAPSLSTVLLTLANVYATP